MPIPSYLVVFGLLGMAFAAVMFFAKRAAFRRCLRVPGIITGLIEKRNNDSDNPGVTFAPRISFQTKSGEKREFTSSVSSYPAPQVGSGVSVLYDPDDPEDATIDSVSDKYLFEIFCFSIGLIIVVIYLFQQLFISH